MKVQVENAYRLLHPRPVVLICAERNFMACSWITPVSDEPFTIAASIWKGNYTYELIERSGVFTVNIPQPELLNEVWIAGTKSGRKVDKAKLTNLKLEKARKIDCYIIANCLANLECIVKNKVEVGENVVYLAEVVDAYANEGSFDKIWKTKILLHLGGRDFVTFSEPIKPKIR
ncbi:MAG: flavin reductase family protein [Archaeoglobaceae archaeon]|nr:flavin reductase family protein [Archaeoglobaceae archaeon]MCX8151814.1 flavin reductase family protein [Archaeoglobaceae archaeon]MDW8014354.1 flavin reductase family protein [Archaeoglobaceae archaeon]